MGHITKYQMGYVRAKVDFPVVNPSTGEPLKLDDGTPMIVEQGRVFVVTCNVTPYDATLVELHVVAGNSGVPLWMTRPLMTSESDLREKFNPVLRTPQGDIIDSSPTVGQVAAAAHEINRAYCAALGDMSQPEWKDAPEWQRVSAIKGVSFHLTGEHGPSASHESWLKQKLADGWKYGPVKDPEKKEHPCCVPYDELPTEQRAKDYIFAAVVKAFYR